MSTQTGDLEAVKYLAIYDSLCYPEARGSIVGSMRLGYRFNDVQTGTTVRFDSIEMLLKQQVTFNRNSKNQDCFPVWNGLPVNFDSWTH